MVRLRGCARCTTRYGPNSVRAHLDSYGIWCSGVSAGEVGDERITEHKNAPLVFRVCAEDWVMSDRTALDDLRRQRMSEPGAAAAYEAARLANERGEQRRQRPEDRGRTLADDKS